MDISSLDKAKEAATAICLAEAAEGEALEAITAVSISLEGLSTAAKTAREVSPVVSNAMLQTARATTNALSATVLAVQMKGLAASEIEQASMQAYADDAAERREIEESVGFADDRQEGAEDQEQQNEVRGETVRQEGEGDEHGENEATTSHPSGAEVTSTSSNGRSSASGASSEAASSNNSGTSDSTEE
uniref:I/LWEQ domain-containing protein n=1 Tax=Meloidogyne hapla TaxID=6305 RepID=A0A1I8BN87_MELHA